MEILILIALISWIFGDDSNNKKKKSRRSRDRKHYESLGYYEHLYGQGHP